MNKVKVMSVFDHLNPEEASQVSELDESYRKELRKAGSSLVKIKKVQRKYNSAFNEIAAKVLSNREINTIQDLHSNFINGYDISISDNVKKLIKGNVEYLLTNGIAVKMDLHDKCYRCDGIADISVQSQAFQTLVCLECATNADVINKENLIYVY